MGGGTAVTAASATFDVVVPAGVSAPNGVASFVAVSDPYQGIDLTWQPQATNADGYLIETKLGSSYSGLVSLGSNAVNYADRSVVPLTIQAYRIRAFNRGGFSSPSPDATATAAMLRLQRGGTGSTLPNGTVAPGSGLIWEIRNGTTQVATNLVSNNWSVSGATDIISGVYSLAISAPISASAGNDYSVRQTNGSAPFSVVTPSVLSKEIKRPGWAESSLPLDSVDSGGQGVSKASSIDLSSGVYRHLPPADLSVSNPNGPDASYQRGYRSTVALRGLSGTPSRSGMSVGWYDNYGFTIGASTTAWSSVNLNHPNGATEVYTPQLSSGVPSGAFSHPTGSPYVLEGTPTATTGSWQSLRLRMKDLSTWTFTPSSTAGTYRLSKITNVVGLSITFNRATDGRLTSIVNDDGLALLTFAYDANNRL